MTVKKVILGRGLSSLLSDEKVTTILHDEIQDVAIAPTVNNTALQMLDINHLSRGKYQPRLSMDESAIDELASSIKEQGIIQPIVVRKKTENNYEIIAGERRWTAAKKAKLTEVPVIIKEINDQEALAIALIENLQREDLNALEEAKALARLIKEFDLTHQQAGAAVGKSRVAVSNLLRLLNLPEIIQKYLDNGDIEMGHARALLVLSESEQLKFARLIIENNLSVRQIEAKIREREVTAKPSMLHVVKHNPRIDAYKEQLADLEQYQIEVKALGKKGAKFTIKCKNPADIEGLIASLVNAKRF